MHRRDDDLRAVDQVVDKIARLAPYARTRFEVLGHLLHQIEAAAARESLADATNDRHGNLRIGIDVAPDLRQLAMRLRIGHGELAFAPHDDLEDARLRALEDKALVRAVAHLESSLEAPDFKAQLRSAVVQHRLRNL